MIMAFELAWAAGLFEGEGSLCIHNQRGFRRTYYRLAVAITSTDPDVVEFFRTNWPGTGRTYKLPSGKTAYEWNAVCRQAAAFLTAIHPYMRAKRLREKVRLALEFQSHKRTTGRRNESAAFYAREIEYQRLIQALTRREAA